MSIIGQRAKELLRMNKRQSGSISTIYHKDHDLIKSLVKGSRAPTRSSKADFLSRIILLSQVSDYTIGDDDKPWVCQTYRKLTEITGLSESTMRRYLNEFAEDKLIEKHIRKRFIAEYKQELPVVWIQITEYFHELMNTSHRKKQSMKISTQANDLKEQGILEEAASCPHCAQELIPPPVKTNDSFFNISGLKNNNNINGNDIVNNGNNFHQYTKYAIEKDLGGRITEELLVKIKGAIGNFKYQHNLVIHDEEKLFAELVFYTTEPGQCSFTNDPIHRLNIASKKIRKKKWSQPKGFEKYWDVGELFKVRREIKEKRQLEEELARELKGIECAQQRAEIKAAIEAKWEEDRKYSGKARKKEEKVQLDESTIHGRALMAERKAKKKTPKPTRMSLDEVIAQKETLLYEAKEHVLRGGSAFKAQNQRTVDVLTKEIAALHEKRAMRNLVAAC